MKIHKIALIASVLILPAQALLAASANHERLVQPAATKVVVMSAKKTTKSNHALPDKKQVGVIAGPGTTTGHTQSTVAIRDRVIAKMGVNLKILSVGWDDEICAQACPQLRTIGLGYPTCDLAFRATNTGDVASGNFIVDFHKTDHLGNESSSGISGVGGYALAPHETKTFKIAPIKVGFYRLGRPITLTLDRFNSIPETNENDNSATFVPR